MKHTLSLLFLIFVNFSLAQQVDYNTSKNFLLEGYDVVSYFTSNKPLRGKNEYIASYDGIKLKFSSKKNLDLFLKNPKKYMPETGGYCAYAIAVKKQKMDVDPEKYEIRDGKLYLFYSSWLTDRLKDWQNGNTKELQKKAEVHWNEMKYNKK